MKVLVAGADRVDAGKTTFATGLLARLDGVGFKPRAGNDYWFDHDDCRSALADGRLYGKDASRLAVAGAADTEPEAINPVHRLWRPAPEGDAFIGRADRQFVLDRAGDRYVVNANAEVPQAVVDTLPLDDAYRVATVEELNDAIERFARPALRALADRVRAADVAVVESYGDVARPLAEFVPDRVAVVEPGQVRVYDGDRYADACDVAGGRPMDGRLETRVGNVVDLIDPVATAPLEPLPGPVREAPARVAEAYASAYDALLDG